MKKLITFLLLVNLAGLPQTFAQYSNTFRLTLLDPIQAQPTIIQGITFHNGHDTTIYRDPSNGAQIAKFVDAVNWIDAAAPISTLFENVAIMRHGYRLCIESRAFPGMELSLPNDTLILKINNYGAPSIGYAYPRTNYRMQLLCDFDPTYTQIGKLEDLWTGTSVNFTMNGASLVVDGRPYAQMLYNFNVALADSVGGGINSQNPNRFRIIFSKNLAFRPFRFDSQSGSLVGSNKVKFDWHTVENQEILSYEIQEKVFSKFTSIKKVSAEEYQKGIVTHVADPKTKTFRIKANVNTGKAIYSDAFMLTRQAETQPQITRAFRVVNPAGRTLQLAFDGEYGKAQVQLVNTVTAQRIVVATIQAQGTVIVPISAPTGTYTVSVLPEQGPALAPRQIQVNQ